MRNSSHHHHLQVPNSFIPPNSTSRPTDRPTKMSQTNAGDQSKCCGGLLSLGVIALFLWLSYRPVVPRYYLVSFSLPSPKDNRTLTSYQLEIENKCWSMGVYHDDISLALSPGNLTSSVPPFYQGHKKTADKSGSFAGEQKTKVGSTNATKAFRVGLESGYRYKVWWWKTKRRRVSLGCDVEVDGDGMKTAEKGIRLTSAATTTTSSVVGSLVLAVAVAGIIL